MYIKVHNGSNISSTSFELFNLENVHINQSDKLINQLVKVIIYVKNDHIWFMA
jgi:hypothetical protein